jgi:membrane protein YqaA with SNARE-associated domain
MAGRLCVSIDVCLSERPPSTLCRGRRAIIGRDERPVRVTTIFDRLERFAASTQAAVLVGAWAIAEAIALPVVPDVLLYLLALAAPRQAGRLFAAAIAGALAGSAVLAGLAMTSPDLARSLVLAVPGIDQPLLQAAQRAVAGGDVLVFVGFGPGTPLKVYTLAWTLAGGSSWLLVLGVIVNRLTRMGPGVVLTAVIGALAPAVQRRHERLVLAVYTALWIATYVIYFA